MSKMPKLSSLSDDDLAELDLMPAGAVDLRRDLYQFVGYVQDRGLLRTKRTNGIPKVVARRLAKLLSYAGEAEAVEEDGQGYWSDHVSRVALSLGLVSFDTEGEYAGYSSAEPSFADNEIEIEEKAWRQYLAKTPLEKETTILNTHLKMTQSEFFYPATLVEGGRFDHLGSATGPASRMKFTKIRRALLKFLADLKPDVWYEMRDVVQLLQARAPNLILDPDTRGADSESQQELRDWEYRQRWEKKKGDKKPEVTLTDIYTNFRESGALMKDGYRREQKQITSNTPEAFREVEGRYLEFFLCEIPYLCGFVELAFRKSSDRHGLDVDPHFERLRAFRLTSRFFQIMAKDAEVDRVKVVVLPNFEVLVEARSYPETTLDALAPHTKMIREEGPVYRLRLERRKVVEAAAQNPAARSVVELLEGLIRAPLPQNVSVELASWFGHGEKVIFYEGFTLVEFHQNQEQRGRVLSALDQLVEDDSLDGFAIVKNPQLAFQRLEEGLHIPLRIKHRSTAFVSSPGRLQSGLEEEKTSRKAGRGSAKPAAKVRLESEDLVGYRSANDSLLKALHKALEAKAKTCVIIGGDLLVLSAASLPQLRSAIRKLSDRFDVTIDQPARDH